MTETQRVAIVTGAAGGIGSSIARQLMRQGAIVHGLDQDSDGLKRLTEEADAGSFAAYPVDLADRAELDRVLGDVLDGLQQRCDILVNNVGGSAGTGGGRVRRGGVCGSA